MFRVYISQPHESPAVLVLVAVDLPRVVVRLSMLARAAAHLVVFGDLCARPENRRVA